MGNFTDSQILILVLIATSNVILIVVAFVLLFSGRQTRKVAPKKNGQSLVSVKKEAVPVLPPEPKKEYIEPKIEIEEEDIKAPEPIIPEIEEDSYDDDQIDYENYSVDQYSDEEYKYATIEEFENAQEENAIISYRELMKLKGEEDIPAEPVKPKAKSRTYNNANYGAGEFISPVFGRMSNEYEYVKPVKPIERKEKVRYNSAPERRANIHTNSNTEFLNALKEFRNNL